MLEILQISNIEKENIKNYKYKILKERKDKKRKTTHTCDQECDVHLIVMLTEVSGASKVSVVYSKMNISLFSNFQRSKFLFPVNLTSVDLCQSRRLHQYRIGPRMTVLHWSWESSQSQKGLISLSISPFVEFQKYFYMKLFSLSNFSHIGRLSGLAQSQGLTQLQHCN